jgi:anti-sigma factor RsiW
VNSCEGHRVNILLFVHEELKGQELENFHTHLANCAECRALLEEEEALSRLLHRSRPLYSAPKSVHDRVSAVMSHYGPAPDSASKPFRPRVLDFLHQIPWKPSYRPLGWWGLLAVAPVIALFFILVPAFLREVHAASYVETALATHRSYLNGNLPLTLQSDSPEEVTAWFAGKVPFHFQLPSSQMKGSGMPAYRLTGARLVNYKDSNAAFVTYEMQKEKISLMVISSKAAVAAAGDVVRSGGLAFHYHNNSGFKVITWTNNGLTYALVSSLAGSPRQSCLVCHQAMPDTNNFR